MKKLLKNLRSNTLGGTAIEYSLIAALVGIVLVTSASTLGNALAEAFDDLACKIDAAKDGAVCETGEAP